ncbi:uncharacterized protein PRCAT00001054001 [Priceomyces carsonii]|uniref:uncharacterized protein n=1 Tax=Priceomyces carsonii TaxID=28549 RepID=UPI002EDAE851|nr:unnamed protein product [Priceomyces carsonii]
MIISKKNHLEKVDMTETLKSLINQITNCSQEELPLLLNENLTWERPRGDLLHWVSVLNRFDKIFEEQIKKYALDQESPELKIIEEQDQELLSSCLQFTHSLLEHCANRSIYASSHRIFQLINTCTVDIRLKALEVAVSLGERYSQTNSSKYAAPKLTKLKVVEIAKSFPPPIPSSFIQDHERHSKKKNSAAIIGDHYSLIDSINKYKVYPSKWKTLNFLYYKSVMSPSNKKIRNEVPGNNIKKETKTTKPKSKKNEYLVSHEGLSSFKLSEESLQKLSLQHVYDKASLVIPKDFWFNFSLSALVAKSFNSNLDEAIILREKLLRVKCLAIAFVCCMCPSEFTSSRLFESEPYIFNFLVDLIQPENDHISKEVYFCAIRALECISLKRLWGSELLRCLSGNVSHGILFQIIRYINKKIRAEDDDCFEKGYIHFFNMLGNLIDSKSLTPRLAAGGILSDLLMFFNVRTKYRWTCSAAIHLTTVFLSASPESFDDFVNKDGFNLLIETIQYEVSFALEHPEFGGPPKESVVYYTITFRQANCIRNLMKLVSHLIQSDSGDRLRNLFDSPLLISFNQILMHPSVFGPLILSSTIDSVFYIIHNEPTAFSILNEAKVIDTILDNYENLFLPSSDLLMSLPEVLGAICLNNEGLKKVNEKKSISIFFKSFFNAEYAKELVRSDMATNLGCSFDELGRHYPPLKPVILNETKKLVEKLNPVINERMNGIRFYSSEKGCLYHSSNETVLQYEENCGEIESWEHAESSYILDNALFFLGGLLQDSGQWGADAMREINYELWSSLLTIENAPFDFTNSNGVSTLMGILKYFDDEKRDYGLPILISILKRQVEDTRLQEFIRYESTTTSFFTRFENDSTEGTIFMKKLNSLNSLLYTLVEIYINPTLMFHERYHQITDLFGGYGLKFISDLGLLLQRSIIEEILIRSSLPADVAMETLPVTDGNNEFPPLQIFPSEPSSKREKQDRTSAKFKNSLQIRFFCHRFQNYVSTVFSSIGRVCMHKRQEYAEANWRRDAIEITIKLGEVITSLVNVKFSSEYYHCNYILIMMNISLYILSQRERNRDIIQTPLIVSLIQGGFYDLLKNIASYMWNKLITMPPCEVQKSKDLKYISTLESSIVKNALSQILVVFAKSVNLETLPTLPSTKLFFHDGFDRDPEGSLPSAILIQTRIIALEFMQTAVGIESAISLNSDVFPSNVPTPIVEQLVFVAKQTCLAKKEHDVAFIPLDSKNVSPPSEQVAYLISLGMSESDAEHYFKHLHSVTDLKYNEKPDCPQFSISSEEWKECAEASRRDNIDLRIKFPNFRTEKDLKTIRDVEISYFSQQWLRIAELYPKAVESIADLLLSINLNLSEAVMRLFDHVTHLLDGVCNNEEPLAVAIHLLGLMLKNDKVARSCSSIFEKFKDSVISELKNEPLLVNSEHFAYSIGILEQILVYRDHPHAETSPHQSINFAGPPAPYMIDEGSRALIFEGLMTLEGVTSTKSAIALARVLVLYAKDESLLYKISNSRLLNDLVLLSKEFTEENCDGFDLYQTAMMVLLRRCFETIEVLKANMEIDVGGLFNGIIRSKRDLHSCLRENSALVLRNPEVFVDVISKNVRLEGYDGTNDFYQGKIIVTKVKKENDKTEDVEMKDADANTDSLQISGNQNVDNKFDSSGIVHIIITELMEVTREGWLREEKDETEKSSNTDQSKKKEMFKNLNFSYACFLLQALTELLGSYKQAKLEFLTYSKKQNSNDVLKPRSTALNFFMHQLIPTFLMTLGSGIEYDRHCAISSLAKLALLALISTPVGYVDNEANLKKEPIDMIFIRKFFTDILLKVLAGTLVTPMIANARYEKLMDLFDLCGSVLSPKFRDMTDPLLNKELTKYDQFFIARALIDKQIPNQITSILSEIDLNFPSVNKVIRLGLKPLTLLGKAKTEFQELFEGEHQGDKEDDDIVPEEVDDKEEAPDLFRNSTLGMYDIEYDSDDEEMDYYEEGGPLEVLVSGDEISESDESAISELDSEDDNDEISVDERYSNSDDALSDDEESQSHDDIEIIDELGVDSNDDSQGSTSDDDTNDMMEDPELYDFDEEDASEYDDEELDGWIEEFEDGEQSLNEPEVDLGDEEVESTQRSRRDNPINVDFEFSSDDSAEDVSGNESLSDNDLDTLHITSDDGRRNQSGLTSILDIFRPERGGGSFSALLSGFLGGGDSTRFRGSVHIDGDNHSFHYNHNHYVLPSFERAFESMLQLGSGSKSKEDPLSNMYVKSTGERWIDSMKMFYDKNREECVFKVIPAIINRISEDSIELFKEKKEEAQKLRKEREEKLKKKEEEKRKKREEEAKQREMNAAINHSSNREPIMVRIGEREIDISGTDIDPEFFEALPDDMREEVFTQHVRERRANATSTGTDAREIDPDFLDALPDQIREEILQQESMARRYSSHELRFDDEDDDEDFEDEGRDLDFIRLPSSGDVDLRIRLSNENRSSSTGAKKSKVGFFTPLVDRSGISSIIRLLFIPQAVTRRESIHQSLQFVCHNKQSRIEVMSLILGVLHDGLLDQKALERCYSQISFRALGSKKQKQSLFPVRASPIVVGIQMMESILYLLEHNVHLRYYLLTEHDNLFFFKKVNQKTKANETKMKERKYPINFLLHLLNNGLVKEEQVLLDVLARVLQISTRPLHVLNKVSKNDDKNTPFSPPFIPDRNFALVIKILTSKECSNTTFRRTISAMENLSVLPNAQKVFSKELSEQATKLGQLNIKDLNDLTTEIKQSQNYNSESKSIAQFSAASSDQAKLLRILTALDYMYDSKEKQNLANADLYTLTEEVEELTELYKKLALGSLWDALSDCLRVIEERQNLTNVATVLLPLIEALMVVCKHSKVKDLQIKDVLKFEAKKIDFTKEPIESLFFSFTDEHKKILNQMVRTNPNLMSGPFGMLVSNPKVLEFDNKKNYFDRKLHLDKNENSKMLVSIRRDQVFLDSYRALFFKPKDEFKKAKLEIGFKGEAGVDAGGVTREWFQVLSRQMFNPDYALFTPVASDETTFHPNRTSYINPEHLSFFKFIGRIIGKAIYDGSYLDCHFSRAVYKRILGIPVSLKDMETLDLEYFKSLMWMLENDITDVITEDFSVETDDYGEHKIIDLVENGRNIPVTEQNKHDYVRKVVEYRLQTSVAEQMDNFLIGFHEIIPKQLVGIFDEQELELLISGLPDIDVTDWQNNTVYNNYSPSSLQIQWFWRAVKSFDNEERAKLLQFATGTSKVPLNGFKELSGADGTCKFSIHRDYGSTERLPSSHTCFNQIDLPSYVSYETLRGSLLLAITEGHEGFGLA